jgi:SAM-dependent MidA family methyltransferase
MASPRRVLPGGKAVTDLPAPPAEALALSAQLSAHIRREIAAARGSIPFSRFMALCLYRPGLGYYSAGARKFGAAGDFVTAPEISPLFGRCLAQTCCAVLRETGGDLLEFGAGSGRLAVDLLTELERRDALPRRYLILETGAELRERQRQTLERELPRLCKRVRWLDALPEAGFRGVVLANEVLDAMPVERFRWTGEVVERFLVCCDGDGFAWSAEPSAEADLVAAVARLHRDCNLPPGFVSEFNPALESWVRSIAGILDRGLLLLADYGYPRHEYYHLQRSAGTLMCHYRQRAHTDPLRWPGLQDITAHVDFTAVAEAGVAAGMTLAGYTTQSWFLLDCGLEEFLQEAGPSDTVTYMKLAQQAKTLILPGEMGERFKLIGLARGVDGPLPGFRTQDLRHRL